MNTIEELTNTKIIKSSDQKLLFLYVSKKIITHKTFNQI
jgi:hypothetical protein